MSSHPNQIVDQHLQRDRAQAGIPQPAIQSQAQGENTPRRWPWTTASGTKLIQAMIFGMIFGFLLQKGGVAKFDILIGVLLLENYVVVQVMLSAIIVGMLGVYLLQRMGVLEQQIKPARLGANIIGGLIFGVGFGLIAYCPGTSAAAAGQGNLDAIIGIAGMISGSYLFALSSGFMSSTIGRLGYRGTITLPELVGLSQGVFILIAVPLLVSILVLIEVFDG